MRRKLHFNLEKVEDRKGFTLIEVLAVVVIIAIISGVAITVYLSSINKSKNEASVLAINSVKEAAELYVKEKSNDIFWFNKYDNSSVDEVASVIGQYSCVTINQLINAGYFKEDFFEKDIYKNTKIGNDSYVQLMRDKDSKAVLNVKVFDQDVDKEQCEIDAAKNEGEVISIENQESYTDRIRVVFKIKDNVTYNKIYFYLGGDEVEQKDGSINNYTYFNLKKDTVYNVKICAIFDDGSSSCVNREIKTRDFNVNNISVSNENEWSYTKDVSVKYDDTGVFPNTAKHYFKADFSGIIISGNFYVCSGTDFNNCNRSSSKITEIEKDKWYFTDSTDVKIRVTNGEFLDQGNSSGVKVVIEDESGNYREDHKVIKKIAREFTVSYNAGGGTGTMADTVVKYGTSVNLSDCTFLKTGYSFLGWHAYRDYDKTWYGCTNTSTCNSSNSTLGWHTSITNYYKYANKQSVSKTAPAGKVTMYAQWGVNTYTLYYNNNGGSGCTSTKVTYGANYPSLCTPTRTGYTFIGWYTSASGGSQVTTSNKYTIADNSTIYAHWKANTYTLNYNNNGGGGCTSTTVTYGANYPTLCTPTRTGYKFNGWYTSASGGVEVTTSNKYTTVGNSTIYAHWTAYKVTIYFKADKDSSVTSASSKLGFSLDSSYYITKNGSRYSVTYTYGAAAKDLPNNNNSSYLELSKSARKLLTAYAWKNGSIIYSAAANYVATDFASNVISGDRTVTLSANWGFKAVRIDGRWRIWSDPGYYQSSASSSRLCSITSETEKCYNSGTSEYKTINSKLYGAFRNVSKNGNNSTIVFGYVRNDYKPINNATYFKIFAGYPFLKIYVPYVTTTNSDSVGYIKEGAGGSINAITDNLYYYSSSGNSVKYYGVWIKGTCNTSNSDCSASGVSILGRY